MTDQQLLVEYAARQSDAAFAQLVTRHVDLVYSAALRMVCDRHLAQDVTQKAFVALAQSAARLTDHASLAGWLHRAAQNIAANTVRSEVRRRAREQEAAMNLLPSDESDATWEMISPRLDAALGELTEAERDALMLRYFEHKSAREMAGILGTTEDAAQKRVNRAVEHLRDLFSKQRLTIGAGALITLLSVNAVQSAPVGLAATISAAVLAGTALPVALLHMGAKTIAGTAFSKAVLAAAVAVVALGGIYTARRNSSLHREIEMLALQQAPLAAQVQKWQQAYEDSTNQLAGLLAENQQWQSGSNQLELLRLRGEVTRLENEIDSLKPKVAAKVASPWSNWNNDQKIGSFYAVAATATETVAVGIDGRIATRNNANGRWRIQTFTGDPDFRAVIYANGQFVVVREKGSIMTSPDGIHWTKRYSPTREDLLGIFWDGHQYLAGGNNGIILSSSDGRNWTVRNSGSRIGIYGFCFSGACYVAAGNDGILVSRDSIHWTPAAGAPVSVPFTACTWTGSEFLACGLGLDKSPTIYTSSDGTVWTLRDTTITASLRSAITVNGIIFISGDSVIAQSADGGSTWTNTFINSGGNKLFMGLASDGASLIAAGFNHNVWAMPLPGTQ